jgi:hypothetical protein
MSSYRKYSTSTQMDVINRAINVPASQIAKNNLYKLVTIISAYKDGLEC